MWTTCLLSGERKCGHNKKRKVHVIQVSSWRRSAVLEIKVIIKHIVFSTCTASGLCLYSHTAREGGNGASVWTEFSQRKTAKTQAGCRKKESRGQSREGRGRDGWTSGWEWRGFRERSGGDCE